MWSWYYFFDFTSRIVSYTAWPAVAYFSVKKIAPIMSKILDQAHEGEVSWGEKRFSFKKLMQKAEDAADVAKRQVAPDVIASLKSDEVISSKASESAIITETALIEPLRKNILNSKNHIDDIELDFSDFHRRKKMSYNNRQIITGAWNELFVQIRATAIDLLPEASSEILECTQQLFDNGYISFADKVLIENLYAIHNDVKTRKMRPTEEEAKIYSGWIQSLTTRLRETVRMAD